MEAYEELPFVPVDELEDDKLGDQLMVLMMSLTSKKQEQEDIVGCHIAAVAQEGVVVDRLDGYMIDDILAGVSSWLQIV